MDELNKLRKKVDQIDLELIKLFKKRFELAIEIWKIKKPLGMKVKNLKREREIIDKVTQESGFNKKFVKKLYNIIFIESRRLQK